MTAIYWLGHHSRAAVVANSWRIVDHCQMIDVDEWRQTVKLQSVLRLCSGFYRSKDPTNSIKVLKEVHLSTEGSANLQQATILNFVTSHISRQHYFCRIAKCDDDTFTTTFNNERKISVPVRQFWPWPWPLKFGADAVKHLRQISCKLDLRSHTSNEHNEWTVPITIHLPPYVWNQTMILHMQAALWSSAVRIFEI